MRDKSKLLIVEDKDAIRERLARVMGAPPAEWLQGTLLGGFEVSVAGNVAEAREMLLKARESGQPFEVVLLDIQLPETHEDATLGREHQRHGRNFLKEIRDRYGIAVVILTGFPSMENLVHAVRQGAADFVVKPLVDRDAERLLFARLVSAVGKTREVSLERSRLRRHLWLQAGKFRQHREHSAQGMAADVGKISEEFQNVLSVLQRRFGFDVEHDPDDPLSERLLRVRSSLEQLEKSVWEKVAAGVERRELEELDVARALEQEIRQASPLYYQRGAALVWTPPPSDSMRTRLFRNDLQLLVGEIVIGCLESLPRDAAGFTVEFECRRSEDAKDILLAVKQWVKPAQPAADTGPSDLDRTDEGFDFLKRLATNMGAGFDVSQAPGLTTLTIRIPVI